MFGGIYFGEVYFGQSSPATGGTITASVSATLADLTIAAAANVIVTGSVSATLENASISAVGAVTVTGSVSATLEDCSITTSGEVTQELTGHNIIWPWFPERQKRKPVRGRGKLKLSPARINGTGRHKKRHESTGAITTGPRFNISGRSSSSVEELNKRLVLLMLEM